LTFQGVSTVETTHREPPSTRLWVVKFNLTGNLCHLRRFAEGEALLPEVRSLAERLGQELDLLRTVWLEGWVAAGDAERRRSRPSSM
jgi:hypothetical protein